MGTVSYTHPYHSQEKAAKAIADGAFKDEIVPVVIKGKKGDTVFDTDEGTRMSSMEVLGKLKPCFKKDVYKRQGQCPFRGQS